MQIFPNNYIGSWLKRSLFALLLLSLCRIFFIFYLSEYFKGAPTGQIPSVMLWGVLFDVQAMVYFLLPFHLISILPLNHSNPKLQLYLKIFFVLGCTLLLILNLIDFEFFKIKNRRSGIELFQLLSDPANPVLSYILNYWWLSVLLIGVIILIIKIYPKHNLTSNNPTIKKGSIAFILIAALLFLGARGSIGVKPLRSFDAAAFVDAQWVPACINSPTQLLTSYSTRIPQKIDWYSEHEVKQLFQPVQSISPSFNQKPNVVLIILESFGRDYCGFLNKEKRFTPFLDSLAKLSLSFTNAYSSGTTSMESLPAIFASIPSLLDVPYINSAFQSNQVNGIHHYLSKHGYDCSFYYGAKNGSMGFDNFLKITGPISYYGLDEYPSKKSDFDGHWGIWDEPYLQYYAEELKRKKGPFFSSVFTLTSHDPYHIPDQYASIFTANELPIHKSVQYTDYALKQFFHSIWKSGLINNTIFIITADHPSHSKNEYFYAPTGKYEIPLLVYSPKFIAPGTNDSVTASHPDIFPTIMGMTGVTDSIFTFGRNLLSNKSGRAINYDNGMIQSIDYPMCIRYYPNGKSIYHIQPKYTPNTRIRYQLNEQELNAAMRAEMELKAKYQMYINALLSNQFKTP